MVTMKQTGPLEQRSVSFLGFTLEWEHRFEEQLPLYAQIRRSDLVTHLSEHYGDATPGSTILVPLDDIDALHSELTAKNFPYAKPGVDEVPWGREMEIGGFQS
ncbi:MULTISPECIES: glyoxalase superfamily protein [Nitrosospira]|nr:MULTISPECIES: glyoxalase superfamily protein [Nitrosospira]